MTAIATAIGMFIALIIVGFFVLIALAGLAGIGLAIFAAVMAVITGLKPQNK